MNETAFFLSMYYRRFFPFEDYYRWLSYGNLSRFTRREFSFTIKDDVFIRYQSFLTLRELENEVKRLLPAKIDVGAIYNCFPKDHHKGCVFYPNERELVLDIDMSDYDDIRTCCKGASVCKKCWKFLALASKILDIALRMDFAYKHILWVFSGRRGIHCWVCDPSARTLEGIERGAVAQYLHILEGGVYMKKKVNLPGDEIHPSLRRALKMIEPIFVPVFVEEQNMLGTPERIEKFLEIVPDEETRADLKPLFDLHKTSEDRWNAFVQYIKNKKMQGGTNRYQYRHLVEEIMLQYSYPRLDINVSKGMTHLLKSPFSMHPKTGKICIPFSVNMADKFDVENVPTVSTLLDEIEQFRLKEKSEGATNDSANTRIKEYKKTSLNKPLRIFQEFIWNLESERKGQTIKQSDEKMEF